MYISIFIATILYQINQVFVFQVNHSYRQLRLIAYRLNAYTTLLHRIPESQTKAIHT